MCVCAGATGVVVLTMPHTPTPPGFKERFCLGVPMDSLSPGAFPVSRLVASAGDFQLYDSYRWLTFGQVGDLSNRVAKAMRGAGVARGSHVGICGHNSFEWSVTDFACAISGCVSVGLHTTFG